MGASSFERSDEIFARFIVEQLPPGITGLLIAGIFAAAMSSLSSSINSLASASAYDFWAPLRGLVGDEARILRVGKGFTLLWAALLIGGAILFIPLSTRTSAVEVALGIASVVYGGLLGAFALGDPGRPGGPTKHHDRHGRRDRGRHGDLAHHPGACRLALVRPHRNHGDLLRGMGPGPKTESHEPRPGGSHGLPRHAFVVGVDGGGTGPGPW